MEQNSKYFSFSGKSKLSNSVFYSFSYKIVDSFNLDEAKDRP